jgi:uncharacterized protein YndB with AHSA1/START domain
MAKEKDWAGHEFLITREFAAPRELVFKAWTDPKHLAEWWGPKGFTNPVCEWDVRVGGKIYDVMRAPNGDEYPMGGEFREIKPPEKLALMCGALDKQGKMIFEFLHEVTFTEEKGKTKMVLRSRVLKTTPDANRYIGGFEMGMSLSLERLAELVEAPAAWPFSLTREFAAPRNLVWKAWSESEHMGKWFGPKGFTINVDHMDFRVDGTFHYSLHMPNGGEMWGKFTYREIVPQEKIVWMFSFSDKDGGLTRNPFSKTPWPLQVLNETTFAEANGRTTVTIKCIPFGGTDEERQTFIAAVGGMTQGWMGTFQQLAEYLAKL